MVCVSWSSSVEGSTVGRSSEVLPCALVVLVGHFDVDVNFSIDLVLDVVLTIVSIDNLDRNLHWLSFFCLDGDLELVTTGLPVFFLLVTSLNDELNGLTDSAVLEKTGTIAERLVSSSVQEEVEVTVSRCQVVAGKGELDDGSVSSVTEVRSQRCKSCFVHVFTHRKRSGLRRVNDWLVTRGEVDRAGHLSETDTSDGDGDTA